MQVNPAFLTAVAIVACFSSSFWACTESTEPLAPQYGPSHGTFHRPQSITIDAMKVSMDMVQIENLETAIASTDRTNREIVLDLDRGITEINDIAMMPGAYDFARVRLHPDQALERSVTLEGSVTDSEGEHSFQFTANLTAMIEQELPQLTEIVDGGGALSSHAAFTIETGTVFRDTDDELLDPRDGKNSKAIERNIRQAFHQGRVGIGQRLRNIAAMSFENSQVAAIAAHVDGSQVAVLVNESGEIGSAMFLSKDGVAFTVWLREDGLPDLALAGDHVLVFDNYGGSSVDLGIIYPDGSSEVVRDIPVEGELIAFLNGQVAGSDQAHLATLAITVPEIIGVTLKIGGAALHIASCATAIGTAAGSGGIALPLAVFACNAAAISTVTTLGELAGIELLSATEAAFPFTVAACAVGRSIRECGLVVSELVTLVYDQEILRRAERETEIEDTRIKLLPALFSDDFSSDLNQWTLHGSPQSFITNSEGFTAPSLNINGDGSYDSGIESKKLFTADEIVTNGGITISFDLLRANLPVGSFFIDGGVNLGRVGDFPNQSRGIVFWSVGVRYRPDSFLAGRFQFWYNHKSHLSDFAVTERRWIPVVIVIRDDLIAEYYVDGQKLFESPEPITFPLDNGSAPLGVTGRRHFVDNVRVTAGAERPGAHGRAVALAYRTE